jgi:hypothetical protein
MELPRLTGPSPAQPKLPPPKSRFAQILDRVRPWLRTRTGRIVVPSVALVLGILLGVLGILLYALAISGGQPLKVASPSSTPGNIVVQVDTAYLTDLVKQNLGTSGMPGSISDVNVTLSNGAQMTITGNDRFSLLGIGITRPFTLIVQPYVSACYLQMHVIHADLSAIPVTGLVQTFESSINAQLRSVATLPQGFTYCAVGVRTEPNSMFITYSATPLKS